MFANSTGKICFINILFISNNNDQDCHRVAAKWISLNNEKFAFRLTLQPNIFFFFFFNAKKLHYTIRVGCKIMLQNRHLKVLVIKICELVTSIIYSYKIFTF